MRRRSFLARVSGATIGVLGAPTVVGPGAAHTPPGGTPPESARERATAEPLGRLELPDAADAVVGPDGTTVYVATFEGFAVVDTSDPEDPERLALVDGILADHDAGPLALIQDVKVAGDRVLVVGPANPQPSAAGAVLYDVSDPTSPEQIAEHDTSYAIHNAFLTDTHAYLTGNGAVGNPLVILDGEDDLTEVGRWSLFDVDDVWQEVPSSLRVLHDVYVQDERAYLAHWDAGTWIVDVSDPASPETVSQVRGLDPERLATFEERDEIVRESIELPGNDHYATVNEDATLLGIGIESWDADGDGDGGPDGIELYDVSDPTDAEHVGYISPPPTDDPARDGIWTTAHNFELADGHCYSSWYQGGVRVHDVTDPTAPEEVFAWRNQREAMFWTAQRGRPGETFVASSLGFAGDVGPDAPAAEASGTATAGSETPTGGSGTATDTSGMATGDSGADATTDGVPPALYVFPDPVEGPTGSPTDTRGGDGAGADSAVGPGFGALAALAGIGSLALGLRRRRDDG